MSTKLSLRNQMILLGGVILVVAAFWGTVGYVAYHFIDKFW